MSCDDLVLLYIRFFFYGSVDHLDLHSFPTRRSSDLPVAVHPSHVPASGDPADLPARGHQDALLLEPADGDRKSTRLNSSHRCISYAVFCLKKKNKKT